MIDYSLAGDLAKYVRALFIVESGENEHAPLGDGGQALGPGQLHPGFFAQWYGKSHAYPASVTHTWLQAQVVAVASYLDFHIATMGLELAVMGFNLGVTAVLEGERNLPYWHRFQAALATIGQG